MYTKRVFSAKDMFLWTRYETILFFVITSAFVAAYFFLDLDWLAIPWTPLALVGTALAFVIGFQNNSAYSRIWEARKIWGGIVNTSRTFGVFIQDMINADSSNADFSLDEIRSEVKTLTYRHIAWMTALRHAMRAKKPWEVVTDEKTNHEWLEMIRPPELQSTLEEDLSVYISAEDMNYIESKGNKQTALLYLQSHHLKDLKQKGLLWEFSFLELEALIQELFNLQGKSERIKNFPYPRHFASLNYYFIWIFIFLLPLGIVPQFAEIGENILQSGIAAGRFFVWLSIPFCVIVMWVFHTMERIGRTGENPFEGTANDVPISTIARGIEIDLRENLGEQPDDIPAQFPVHRHTQM